MTDWTALAPTYLATLETSYHYDRAIVVERLIPGSIRSCVDFGCGDGWLIARQLQLTPSLSIVGVEPTPEMAAAFRQRLPHATLLEGGLDRLAELSDGSTDCVLAANVLAYMDPEAVSQFYREAWRILTPGGALVTMHSNELFDLYSLNRYTVRFHQRHFRTDVAAFLTQPDQPERPIYPTRENPFTFRFRLALHGFQETQQEFAHFHPAPPSHPQPADPPSTVDWYAIRRWKLLFQCSLYGSRAIKQAVRPCPISDRDLVVAGMLRPEAGSGTWERWDTPERPFNR